MSLRPVAPFPLALALLAAPAAADDLQRGIDLYRQAHYAEAEAVLRPLAGTEAKAYLAASLAKQRRYADAEAPAASALAADATHEVAVGALGESLVGQRKYDQAINRLSDAIRARSDLAYAYFWRGQAYQSNRQPDRMVEDFETFLRLAPNATEATTVRQLLAGLR